MHLLHCRKLVCVKFFWGKQSFALSSYDLAKIVLSGRTRHPKFLKIYNLQRFANSCWFPVSKVETNFFLRPALFICVMFRVICHRNSLTTDKKLKFIFVNIFGNLHSTAKFRKCPSQISFLNGKKPTILLFPGKNSESK